MRPQQMQNTKNGNIMYPLIPYRVNDLPKM
jgi:hypothetical protein